MKKSTIIFILITSLWIPPALGQIKIDVVYPLRHQVVTATDSTFIFGNVKPANAQLSINGFPVPLHSNGAFLAFLPLQPRTEGEEFVFHCQAIVNQDTVLLDWPVQLSLPPKPFSPDTLAADSFQPQQLWILQPGDMLEVSFRGTPGCQAYFHLGDLAEWIQMQEKSHQAQLYWGTAVFGNHPDVDTIEASGIYTGVYIIQPGDTATNQPIYCRLIHPNGQSLDFAYGDISIDHSPVPKVAELSTETTVLRTGPNGVYYLFLPPGTKLHLTGRRGDFWRAKLSNSEDAWIADGDFRWLPSGTLLPRSIVSTVRTENRGCFTRVHIPLQQRLPFHVEQSVDPAELRLRIWGATAATNWIRHDFTSPVVREIRWSQPAREVFELTIRLNQKQQWGYASHYDGTNLLLDIKHTPKIARGLFRSPLKGRVVCLDPGHNPDLGAVGPTRLEERKVNLAIALKLKKLLEKKGATVLMTRSDRQGITLQSRAKFAAIVNADVLLSIHNNALPDGINPFQHNGVSTYYYHPQSYHLAKILHSRLLKTLKLPDHGLYYANLAVCRVSQMPAVLVEPAFMMIPEQEALLRTDKFQMKIAKALMKGLEQFFKEGRR